MKNKLCNEWLCVGMFAADRVNGIRRELLGISVDMQASHIAQVAQLQRTHIQNPRCNAIHLLQPKHFSAASPAIHASSQTRKSADMSNKISK